MVEDSDEGNNGNGWAPIGAPLTFPSHTTNFDSSSVNVNAVSFGFVATAILISMFLLMALFEKFLRPSLASKLPLPSSPNMSVYASGVSVLMPGDEVPTFIAHRAPCCPEQTSLPSHQHNTPPCSTSNTLPNINEV